MIAQNEGGREAVVAVAAMTIDDDLFGKVAGGEDVGKVFVGVVMVEFEGAGDVAFLVFVLVASVNEGKQVHLTAGIVEEFYDVVAMQEMEAVGFDAGAGGRLPAKGWHSSRRGNREWCWSAGGRRIVCRGGKVVLGEFKAARRELIGEEGEEETNEADQGGFAQD